MAKGQQRSNREAKKPKKATVQPAKTTAAAATVAAVGKGTKAGQKKR
ncbi:MAG: hypothetical protein HQ495_09700 [Alphaproteobacteria bacterium]|nr:hypothetical protein [Alphaproteobacteria bacterium]